MGLEVVKISFARIAISLMAMSLVGGCGGHGAVEQRVAPPPVPATQSSPVVQTSAPATSPTTLAANVPTTAATAAALSAAQWAHAVNFAPPKGVFAFKYPADWQAINGPEVLDIQQGNFAHRLLTVDVPFIPPHLPGMITLARIEKGFWDDLRKRMASVQIISSGPQTMLESQARRLRATATQGGVPMSIDAVVAMRKERVYILSSETDTAGAADGDAALEMILASWKWTQ
jgi:hypothetical protein